jgi:integrase/recombinase XerD
VRKTQLCFPLRPPQPRLADAPAQWLPARLANKLAQTPFASFGALFEAFERDGYYWWRAVPKLGATSGLGIVRWMHGQGDVWGRPVPPDVLKKPPRSRAPMRTRASLMPGEGGAGQELALVPLDRFAYPLAVAADPNERGAALPARLDGVDGTNRAPPVGEPFAANDYDAVQRWLATVADRPNTHRTYRKEAERLLLWAVYQRGKALSSLDLTDCVGYRDFLAALDAESGVAWVGPLSREDWIGPQHQTS